LYTFKLVCFLVEKEASSWSKIKKLTVKLVFDYFDHFKGSGFPKES